MEICKEVRDLIRINERIQSSLVQGDRMTDDEIGLIRICANELLMCAVAQGADGERNHSSSLGEV